MQASQFFRAKGGKEEVKIKIMEKRRNNKGKHERGKRGSISLRTTGRRSQPFSADQKADSGRSRGGGGKFRGRGKKKGILNLERR